MKKDSPPILIRETHNRNDSLPIAGIDFHDSTLPPHPFGVHFEDDPMDRTIAVRDEDIAGLDNSHSDTLELQGWECGDGPDDTLVVHPSEQRAMLQERPTQRVRHIKLNAPAISQKKSQTPTTFTTKCTRGLILMIKALWFGESNGRITTPQKANTKAR